MLALIIFSSHTLLWHLQVKMFTCSSCFEMSSHLNSNTNWGKGSETYRISEKYMENMFSDWNWKCFSLPGLLLEFQFVEMWNFNFCLGKLFGTSKGAENSIHLGAEMVPKSHGVPCLAPHTPANRMEKQCRVPCKHSPAFCYVLFSTNASLQPGNRCCVVLSCFHCTSEQGPNLLSFWYI